MIIPRDVSRFIEQDEFKEIASFSHGKKRLLFVLISRDTFLSLAPLSSSDSPIQ